MKQVYKAMLIDDEPGARRLMKSLLQEYDKLVEVIAEAGNGEEAIEKIESLKPDLVFLDIQLPDLNGFEIIERLSYKPGIIFITAFEQYAIKAFDTFSIDYLMKPVKEERLKHSMEKLKKFGHLQQPVDLPDLREMIRQFKTPQKATALPIRTGDRITLLRYENIVYLQAEDKYVFVFTSDGQRHLTDHSLHALSERLPPQFYRIQKSYIINKEKIREMHRHFNGRYIFIMDDRNGTRLSSGRTYYDEIRDEFGL